MKALAARLRAWNLAMHERSVPNAWRTPTRRLSPECTGLPDTRCAAFYVLPLSKGRLFTIYTPHSRVVSFSVLARLRIVLDNRPPAQLRSSWCAIPFARSGGTPGNPQPISPLLRCARVVRRCRAHTSGVHMQYGRLRARKVATRRVCSPAPPARACAESAAHARNKTAAPRPILP